jgi:hypothetical protein
MPEKYYSKCPKKLDFSFFVKDKSTMYTPTAQIYAMCYMCREKQTLKQKRKDTVSDPTPNTLPCLVTPLLGPLPPPPLFGPQLPPPPITDPQLPPPPPFSPQMPPPVFGPEPCPGFLPAD